MCARGCMHVCACAMCACVCVCACACARTCAVCVHVHVCTRVCVLVSVCVCACVSAVRAASGPGTRAAVPRAPCVRSVCRSSTRPVPGPRAGHTCVGRTNVSDCVLLREPRTSSPSARPGACGGPSGARRGAGALAGPQRVPAPFSAGSTSSSLCEHWVSRLPGSKAASATSAASSRRTSLASLSESVEMAGDRSEDDGECGPWRQVPRRRRRGRGAADSGAVGRGRRC